LPRPSGAEHWALQFWRRVAWHFVPKLLLISAFMWVFFAAYFHVLRHPAQAVAQMPLTVLDQWVIFEPAAFWIYVSLWVYVGAPAGLTQSYRQLVVYGFWVGCMCLVGLLCFYLWPTAVPPGLVPADAGSHPGFKVLQGVDAPGNACPSLHVASAVFSAVWLHRLLRQMGAPLWALAFNGLWGLLIMWSTMAIKQHVALDVLAGLLLALLFVVPSVRWFPRRA
jgi:membrane-associated phospholipid phosphatase